MPAVHQTRRMPTASPLPDRLGAEFSVASARAAGVTPRRLRAGDLESHYSGARVVPRPRTDADRFARELEQLVSRCREFATIAPMQYCFSHSTAAGLYGIPLPPRLRADGLIDVSVPAAGAQPRRRGVRGHRLDAWRTRVVDGLPLVPAAVAWAQLASLLTRDELVIAGDFLVRRKRPLCTLVELRDAAEATRRDARRVRMSLLEIRPGTDSPPETETRLVLVRHGLPEPVVGHTVFHEGFFVGTPDLAYVAERIAIEYQGSGHWLDRDIFEDDITRRELFERAGWKIILVTRQRLSRPALLAREVAAVLRQRAI